MPPLPGDGIEEVSPRAERVAVQRWRPGSGPYLGGDAMGGQHPLVTDAERDLIRRLHAEGKGRNEIARLTGRAQRTVSVEAAEMGLVFDCTWTEEATKHRMAQLAALRAETAYDLHVDGMKLTQRMWEPCKVFSFGGKDNTYNDEQVDEPPSDAKKNLMSAAGIAFEKSLKLCPPETGDGEAAAKGLVGDLITGLTAIHRERQREAAADEGAGDAP